MIKYAETFERVTPESAAIGEAEERGFIDKNAEAGFRDMVELLQGAEPSASPLPAEPSRFVWFTQYDTNEGTREYYETGVNESRSYHPKDERAARYMVKAWRVGNA